MKEPLPTLAELTELCRDWQRILRLQDWRVRIRYAEKFELAESHARAWICPKYKQACIRINPFAEMEEGDIDPWEVALLHELVHIHLQAILPSAISDENTVMEEQAVDLLAWGLYRAKYGDERPDEFLVVEE